MHHPMVVEASPTRARAHSARRRGGGAHSFVACLSHLAIDHASLSRRSTVPTPTPRETPPTFGRSLRFFHILHRNLLLTVSPSCFAVCSHHLSPGIAAQTGGSSAGGIVFRHINSNDMYALYRACCGGFARGSSEVLRRVQVSVSVDAC